MSQAQLKDTSWHIKKKDVVFEPVQDRSLGAGSFGEVFIAKWLGNKVAAKRLHKRVFTADATVTAGKDSLKADERFHREYFLMMSLHHPHIVQLYGVYLPDEPPDAPPVIIMELLSKTLRELINKGPRLLLLEVLDYSLQISSALCYLHGQAQPVIHRDLTTNNIMLTSYGICKIVDLGLAKVFDRAARKELTSRPGNACYMPAEVLAGIGRYDERLDVFSFNIVMLEMANGRVSQPSTDLLEEQPSGLYAPIAETKRREVDLSYLAGDHPLRPLIVSLLQSQKSLPSIAELHERLQTLRQSEEILRECSGEVRAMRHRFEQQEEAHQQEIDVLKETVLSGQQAIQEVLQVVTHDLQGSLRHTQERVDEVSGSQQTIRETLGRTERSVEVLHEELASTKAKVEDASGSQQNVQETLKRTERSAKVLLEDLMATKVKVEEIRGNQQTMKESLQKTEGRVEEISGSQLAVKETLRKTERSVEVLREDLTAMKAKAEEIYAAQQNLKDEFGKVKNEVNKTLSGSQAVVDEVVKASNQLQQVATSHHALQDDLGKVKDALAEKCCATQQAVDGALEASHQVQLVRAKMSKSFQVSENQQTMQKTLSQVEESVDFIFKGLTAAKQEISSHQESLRGTLEQTQKRVDDIHEDLKEVAERQLQRCGRPCAATFCEGKCARPVLPQHSEDECCCELSGCIKDCEICDEVRKKCSSNCHLHRPPDKHGMLHHCGQDHPCNQICEMDGPCTVTGHGKQAGHAGCGQVGINGVKMKCDVEKPVGLPHHDPEPHSCRRQHTCPKQCPLCSYYCELPREHVGHCKTTHGPARNIENIDGARVINAEGFEMTLDPKLTCDRICQAAGRGHFHICTCSCRVKTLFMLGRVLDPLPERAHMHAHAEPIWDVTSHTGFLRSLQTTFGDLDARPEQIRDTTCRAVCPHCRGSETPQHCTKQAGHKPVFGTLGGILHNGHRFKCTHHVCHGNCCKESCVRSFTSCLQPCCLLSGHGGECICSSHAYT